MDPLLLALVAIAGSLFGIWVSHRFQVEREDRRWRHDRKLQAYLNYLAALSHFEGTLIAARFPISSIEDARRREERILALSGARSELDLAASHTALEVAAEIGRRTAEHLGRITRAKDPSEMPGFLDLQGDVASLIAAARKDLGFGR